MIEIRIIENLSIDHLQSLNNLYAPLIGKNALCLYQFLYSQTTTMEQEEIESLLQLNKNQFDSAKDMLIQYKLIKIYTNDKDSILFLYAPLLAKEFLVHDTYSRLYLTKMGARMFDRMKIKLVKAKDIPDDMKEVKTNLDISVLDNWSQEQEIMYEKAKPNTQVLYDFDFSTFFRGMDHIFPVRFRSKKNLERIAELSKIYGVSEKTMKRYVQRSVNPSTGVFDIDKLKNMIVASRKTTDSNNDPYKISPVLFLQNKQNGIPVVKSDKLLIERLCTEFQFPIEVVNTLIEYTLEQTNQQFSRNYVEKVAASWVRLHVDSRSKALEIIQNDKPIAQKKQKIELDDKFYEKKDEKTPEQIQKETLALQQMLKEGKL